MNHKKRFFRLLFAISLITNVILLLFMLFFRNTVSEQKIIYLPMEPSISYNTCENALSEIINDGSDSAYSVIDLQTAKTGEYLLPYALVAANKWKKNYACMDVYYGLLSLYDCGSENIEIMDSITREMAIDYLIKAYEYSSDTTDNQKKWKDHVQEIILSYFEKGKYITIVNNRYQYSGIDNSSDSIREESAVNKLNCNKFKILERICKP